MYVFPLLRSRAPIALAPFLLVLFLLITGGCATAPPASDAADTSIVLPYAAQFDTRGRISVRQGERIDTAGFEWSRTARQDIWKLFTPFGSQVAEIVATPDGARLQRESEVEYGADLGALTQRTLGVRLDAAALSRWIQGIDLDRASSILAGTEESRRWMVSAEHFRVLNGAKVATRVVAREGDTTVRIVIDDFQPR